MLNTSAYFLHAISVDVSGIFNVNESCVWFGFCCLIEVGPLKLFTYIQIVYKQQKEG